MNETTLTCCNFTSFQNFNISSLQILMMIRPIRVQCQDRSALVDFLLWRRGPGQMVLRKKLLTLTGPVVMTVMMKRYLQKKFFQFFQKKKSSIFSKKKFFNFFNFFFFNFFFNLFRMMKLMKNMIPSRIDLKGSLQAKSCLGVPPRKGQDFLAMSTLKLIFDQANLLCEHYSQSLLYK